MRFRAGSVFQLIFLLFARYHKYCVTVLSPGDTGASVGQGNLEMSTRSCLPKVVVRFIQGIGAPLSRVMRMDTRKKSQYGTIPDFCSVVNPIAGQAGSRNIDSRYSAIPSTSSRYSSTVQNLHDSKNYFKL
jgi:hypothetical protein